MTTIHNIHISLWFSNNAICHNYMLRYRLKYSRFDNLFSKMCPCPCKCECLNSRASKENATWKKARDALWNDRKTNKTKWETEPSYRQACLIYCNHVINYNIQCKNVAIAGPQSFNLCICNRKILYYMQTPYSYN